MQYPLRPSSPLYSHVHGGKDLHAALNQPHQSQNLNRGNKLIGKAASLSESTYHHSHASSETLIDFLWAL